MFDLAAEALTRLDNFPWDVRAVAVLRALKNAGHEAYFVGGVVRDVILGQTVNDYDVATAAHPGEIAAIFPPEKLIETGVKHGTYTVISNGLVVELTSYRIDGEYIDGRRPDRVDFTRALDEDLSRRDFTINAMAYSPLMTKMRFVDQHEGLADIAAKLIRAVGNPYKRFSEDALRILRALRLAAELDFALESETAQCCNELAAQLRGLAAERITKELWRFLMAEKVEALFLLCPKVWREVVPDLAEYSDEKFAEQVRGLDRLLPAAILRLVWLLRGTDAHAIELLRLSRRQQDDFKALRSHCVQGIRSELSAKKALGALGWALFTNLISYLKLADPSAEAEYLLLYDKAKIWRDEGICLSRFQLAVSGRDLMNLDIQIGPELGRLLDLLLDEVMSGTLENKAPALMARADVLVNLKEIEFKTD